MTNLFLTRFYKVRNKEPHYNAVDYYYFCKTVDGVKYLFTEGSLIEAILRADKNPEDIPSDVIMVNPEEIHNQREWFVTKNASLQNELDRQKRSTRIWQVLTLICIPVFYAVGYSINHLMAS